MTSLTNFGNQNIYTLTNLNNISTPYGDLLPVSATGPCVSTNGGTSYIISLYESLTNLIDFSTFGKSLNVNELKLQTIPSAGTSYTLYYDTTSKVVSYAGAPSGTLPSATNWSDYLFWNNATSSWNVGADKIHIGRSAGTSPQGLRSLAVGDFAGSISQGDYSCAIGPSAAYQNQGQRGVAIGNSAGYDHQQINSIAVGAFAGQQYCGTGAICIGYAAGINNVGRDAVVIGNYESGLVSDNIGDGCIAIGYSTLASSNKGKYCVAIGYAAMSQATSDDNVISVGYLAGQVDSKANSINIGAYAGQVNPSNSSVNIGFQTGRYKVGTNPSLNLGAYCGGLANEWCLNIGYNCGFTGAVSAKGNISLGINANYNSQFSNNIVIRASSNALGQLNATKDNACFIDPIRPTAAYSETWYGNVLKQDTSTKEIYSFNNYSYLAYINATSNFGTPYTVAASSSIPFNFITESVGGLTIYDPLTTYSFLPDRTSRYKIDVLIRGLNNLSNHYISVIVNGAEIYRKYWTVNTNESMSFSLTRNLKSGDQIYLKTDGAVDLNLSSELYSQVQYTQLF